MNELRTVVGYPEIKAQGKMAEVLKMSGGWEGWERWEMDINN
jgi:hypothetical protein